MTAAAPKRRCPGCSRVLAAGDAWCRPCHLRLPLEMRNTVERAERALDAARSAATRWLAVHPHATDRELEVLALAAQGLSNQQVAEKLHLSVHTVRDAWRLLSQRWGCRGRAHVVARAFELGYLTIGVRA